MCAKSDRMLTFLLWSQQERDWNRSRPNQYLNSNTRTNLARTELVSIPSAQVEGTAPPFITYKTTRSTSQVKWLCMTWAANGTDTALTLRSLFPLMESSLKSKRKFTMQFMRHKKLSKLSWSLESTGKICIFLPKRLFLSIWLK